jgi:osmotically-inducible protein OsmY
MWGFKLTCLPVPRESLAIHGLRARRWGWLMLLALTTMSAGCNRHDADCLARIGRKVAAHTKNSAGDIGAKLDVSWAGSKKEPTLQEKIQDRLRWENTLTDVTVEVLVVNKEVELTGTVKTAQQRQRAIELAETVVGVDKVTDSIALREAEDAAK